MSIAFGSEYVFNPASSGVGKVSQIDSTTSIIVYNDSGNSNYGTAIIATINDTEITYGSEYVFNSGATSNINLDLIDSTTAIITYTDIANSSKGTAIIATISGNIITYGSEYVFNSGSTTNIYVSVLDSTTAIIVYRDTANSSKGTAIIATISGTTISFGSEYIFNSAYTIVSTVTKIDSTTAIITYSSLSDSYKGKAIIATVSGTTISFGSSYTTDSGNSTTPSAVDLIDSTHVIIVYPDTPNSYYGTAIIATISGSTISFGSKFVFNSNYTDMLTIVMLDSTHAIIAYRDGSSPAYGRAITATISGDTISYDSEYTFNGSDPATNNKLAKISSTQAFLAFNDNTTNGTAIICTVSFGSTTVKVWDGSSWIDSVAVKYYDGVSWVDITALNRSDGATWVSV